jgi:hypothetical protein
MLVIRKLDLVPVQESPNGGTIIKFARKRKADIIFYGKLPFVKIYVAAEKALDAFAVFQVKPGILGANVLPPVRELDLPRAWLPAYTCVGGKSLVGWNVPADPPYRVVWREHPFLVIPEFKVRRIFEGHTVLEFGACPDHKALPYFLVKMGLAIPGFVSLHEILLKEQRGKGIAFRIDGI